jgi:hypothetical protein
MPSTIDKKAERHTVAELMKRDGETYMAVGLFIIALAIPVLIGTLWATERPHAALVNLVAGAILGIIGGCALFYGWKLFKRSKTIVS